MDGMAIRFHNQFPSLPACVEELEIRNINNQNRNRSGVSGPPIIETEMRDRPGRPAELRFMLGTLEDPPISAIPRTSQSKALTHLGPSGLLQQCLGPVLERGLSQKCVMTC